MRVESVTPDGDTNRLLEALSHVGSSIRSMVIEGR